VRAGAAGAARNNNATMTMTITTMTATMIVTMLLLLLLLLLLLPLPPPAKCIHYLSCRPAATARRHTTPLFRDCRFNRRHEIVFNVQRAPLLTYVCTYARTKEVVHVYIYVCIYIYMYALTGARHD
jgi:hypothetical protein